MLYFNIYPSIYLDEYLHFYLLCFVLGLARKYGLNEKSSLANTTHEADNSLSRRLSAINVCMC